MQPPLNLLVPIGKGAPPSLCRRNNNNKKKKKKKKNYRISGQLRPPLNSFHQLSSVLINPIIMYRKKTI